MSRLCYSEIRYYHLCCSEEYVNTKQESATDDFPPQTMTHIGTHVSFRVVLYVLKYSFWTFIQYKY